jgi:hypothetical protein
VVPLVRRQRCLELAEHVPASGVNLAGSAAAVTVMNTPTAPQRQHLFLVASDRSLWMPPRASLCNRAPDTRNKPPHRGARCLLNSSSPVAPADSWSRSVARAFSISRVRVSTFFALSIASTCSRLRL